MAGRKSLSASSPSPPPSHDSSGAIQEGNNQVSLLPVSVHKQTSQFFQMPIIWGKAQQSFLWTSLLIGLGLHPKSAGWLKKSFEPFV